MTRRDVLRGLLFKRGWRTFAFGSILCLVLAVASAVGDDEAPVGFWLAGFIGGGVVSYLLYRRSR